MVTYSTYCYTTTGYKWVIVVTELFNTAVNYFGVKKSAYCNRTHCNRYPVYSKSIYVQAMVDVDEIYRKPIPRHTPWTMGILQDISLVLHELDFLFSRI